MPEDRIVINARHKLEPGDADIILAFQLKELISQKYGREFVNKKRAVDSMIELRGVSRWDAFKLLKRLWQCGLATRMGRIDSRSNSPVHQLWKIN